MTSIFRGVLAFGFFSLGLIYAENIASFQLQHDLAPESRVFFAADNQLIFRFSTLFDLDDLRSQASNGRQPISTMEVLADLEGKILKFAVFRFSNVEVYDVRKEDDRLKFVKLEGASALFSGSMSAYRSSLISSKDAIEFLKAQESQALLGDNQRILKFLRLVKEEEAIVSKAEPAKEESKEEFLNLLDQDVREIQATPAQPIETPALVGESPHLN